MHVLLLLTSLLWQEKPVSLCSATSARASTGQQVTLRGAGAFSYHPTDPDIVILKDATCSPEPAERAVAIELSPRAKRDLALLRFRRQVNSRAIFVQVVAQGTLIRKESGTWVLEASRLLDLYEVL